MKDEWVVMGHPVSKFDGSTLARPQVFSTHDSRDEALDKTRASAGRLGELYDPSTIAVMTLDEFMALPGLSPYDGVIHEVSAEAFEEARCTLPPFAVLDDGDVDSFIQHEPLEGTARYQYIALEGRYFTKLVDSSDRSTWQWKDEIDLRPQAPEPPTASSPSP